MSKVANDPNQKARTYLEKHHIDEIISDMINTITQVQMADPIIFMIQFLSSFHCSPAELERNRISINSESMIQPILCIPFPLLSSPNLLKKTLSKEQFFQCKNNISSMKNSIRHIIRLATDSKHPVGLFAIDPDCYRTFEHIYKPILEQHNKNICMDFKYFRSYQPVQEDIKILQHVQPFIEDCVFKMKRNVSNVGFNSILKLHERNELCESILSVLKNQNIIKFNQFIQLDDINLDDAKRILQLNDKLFKQSDQIQASNFSTWFNNKKKGPRYPEWPHNRAIAISQDKQTIVWINKEDHILIKSMGSRGNQMQEQLQQLFRFSDLLDSQIDFAFQDHLGYLNVKPQDVGLGVLGLIKFKIDSKDCVVFRQNIQAVKKLNNPWFTINEKKKESNLFTLQIIRSAGLNKGDLIHQLSLIIHKLFQDIIHINKEQTQHLNFSMPVEHFDYYEENEKNIQTYLSKNQQRQPNQKYNLQDLLDNMNQDYYFNTPNLIERRFFVLRRNLLQKTSVQFRDSIFKDFLTQKQYPCNKLYAKNDQNFQKLFAEIVDATSFNFDFSGTLLYGLRNFYVMTNSCDNYTIFWMFDGFSISQSLQPLIEFIDQFEYFIVTRGYSFAYLPTLGYLTKYVDYSGNGISMYMKLNQEIDKKVMVMYLNTNGLLELPALTDVAVRMFCKTLKKQLEGSKRLIVNLICHPLSTQLQMKELAGVFSKEVPELYDHSELNLMTTTRGLQLLDCWKKGDAYELWAPDEEGYTVFRPLYESIMVKLVGNGLYLDTLSKGLYINRELDILKIQENARPYSPAIQLKFSFQRNFTGVPYCHLLSYKELSQYRQQLNDLLVKLDFDILGQKYTNRYLSVKIYKVHHLQVLCNFQADQMIEYLREAYNFLHQIQNLYKPFQKIVELGYLGPIPYESILGGLHLQIVMHLCEVKNIQLECLVKQFDLKSTEKSNQLTLSIQRPGFLPIEFYIIDQINNYL